MQVMYTLSRDYRGGGVGRSAERVFGVECNGARASCTVLPPALLNSAQHREHAIVVALLTVSPCRLDDTICCDPPVFRVVLVIIQRRKMTFS